MIVGFDGTWNDTTPKKGQRPSNVRRFLEYCKERTLYMAGIGNNDDYSFIMQWVGGFTGLGGKGIIRNACLEVGRMLESGEKALLDVIGFSRGCALALHFANLIRQNGVPLPSTKKRHMKRLPNHGGKGARTQISYTFQYAPVEIHWMGLWDHVPAMFFPFNQFNPGYYLTLPKGVVAHHAMALDVATPGFMVERIKGAEEVWFMGAHSEVGGGWGNKRLEDCTLRWMIGKARKAGVKVDGKGPQLPTPSLIGLSADADQRNYSHRRVIPGDKVHGTVCRKYYPGIPWDKIVLVK